MIKEISVEEVQKAVLEKKNVVVLDVRSPEEYREGHIEGAVNLSVDDLEEKVSSVLTDKEMTIYAYCESGVRSEYAAETLTKLGYKDAYTMIGGMEEWRFVKYPIEI